MGRRCWRILIDVIPSALTAIEIIGLVFTLISTHRTPPAATALHTESLTKLKPLSIAHLRHPIVPAGTPDPNATDPADDPQSPPGNDCDWVDIHSGSIYASAHYQWVCHDAEDKELIKEYAVPASDAQSRELIARHRALLQQHKNH